MIPSAAVRPVVNRDPARDAATTVRLADAAIGTDVRADEVNGRDPNTVNSFDDAHAVTVHERRPQRAAEGELRYVFPAHSVTVLRLPMTR